MIEKFIDKVIQGDVLEILEQLPDNSIDMGVTSPPYNKRENKKGWLVNKVLYSGATDNLPENAYQEIQVNVLDELYRVIKEKGSFFYNHKIRWERGKMIHPMDWLRETKWVIRQEIIWDRMIAGNIRGWRFWQVDERIYWLYKPKGKHIIGEELKPIHALLTSIWRFPPERNHKHPAPFPLALPLRAIYSIMDEKEDGIIIDPYCGSGTTLLAAKILKHHYIGIDISKEYVEYAQNRIENYEKEIITAKKELSKHLVTKTFKERKEKGEFVGKYRKDNKTPIEG
ncbi:MAG TPA: site-specific DNA-methyltransferase [Methanosarcinales archaeon]|nr:site-specific DNA-methyltransferase [Methanosarcinales archaeon]